VTLEVSELAVLSSLRLAYQPEAYSSERLVTIGS